MVDENDVQSALLCGPINSVGEPIWIPKDGKPVDAVFLPSANGIKVVYEGSPAAGAIEWEFAQHTENGAIAKGYQHIRSLVHPGLGILVHVYGRAKPVVG